jgi:hypothetical protein
MELQLYSLYDKKTQVFTPPMSFHNDEHAQRDLRNEITSKGGLVAKFPEDYELYNVGSWNDHDAAMGVLSPVRLVCRIDSLLEPEREESTE